MLIGVTTCKMLINDLFERFQERLAAAGGESHSVECLEQAAEIIAAHPALVKREIIVAPDFAISQTWAAILPLLHNEGIEIRVAGSPASVADAPAGLSVAEVAIAETGSVLLADNALEARVVSMLTLTHFVLVRKEKLFPMLEDAGKLLLDFTKTGIVQRHYISLVTGPSRTADIERTLTIGVQGPKALCVIVVGNI
jgi:L-lactate dehydrogenase complex protein LldG